ncbi:hypothetical protein F5B20DRAFT_533640 [Whalleya microplaca]|nr:hypothetical protein F5B20DRAFT_533640 [Whalleya microplaca]
MGYLTWATSSILHSPPTSPIITISMVSYSWHAAFYVTILAFENLKGLSRICRLIFALMNNYATVFGPAFGGSAGSRPY